MIALLLLACTPEPSPAPMDGALDEGPLNPFPSVELVDDGHLAIPSGTLPNTGLDWDVGRLGLRSGFSVVQPSVVRMPEPIDPDTIAGEAGIGVGGSVRMYDLDSGEELPVLAELDANEDAIESGNPALIVRPMVAMTVGHQVAVVVTDEVTSGGLPIDVPEATGHYAELRARLAGLGVEGITLAWDFPVGDGTAPLTGLTAQLGTPSAWTFTRVWGEGEDTPPVDALLQVEGSFTAQDFLVDDVRLDLDDAGIPQATGTREAYLFVHVPPSVADLESAPILVFGHGIFGDPKEYWADEDNLDQLEIADRMGAIVVGTLWLGLNSDDYLHALQVADEFPRIYEITDMLAQGVANNLQLMQLVQSHDFWEDPVFAPIAGKVDRSRVYYFGISLGSIEGAVTLANQDDIELAALHVGGSDWSTMLERSVQWPVFANVVSRDFPDPFDRQILYSASQLYWDQVDPSGYTEILSGRGYVWQESIADDQVANVTTELLMRSVGAPLGNPAVTAPYGIATVDLPAAGPIFTQFDPMTDPTTGTNMPGAVTSAHTIPRTWEGMKAQVVEYFASGGQVQHFCGDAACTAENTGDP